MTTLIQTGRKEQGEKSETKRGKKKKRESRRAGEKEQNVQMSPNAQKTMKPSKCASFFGYDVFPCPWSFKIHRDPSHTSFRNMRCSFQTEDKLTKAGWQQNTQHGTATLQSYIVRTDILQSDLTNTFTMRTMPHFSKHKKNNWSCVG